MQFAYLASVTGFTLTILTRIQYLDIARCTAPQRSLEQGIDQCLI